jgi:methylsterol monooxygenase
MYKAVHKVHHEWQAPISLASIYCHPFEHVLSNVIPIFAGPIVMRSHLSTAWFWMSLATINTLIVHSGYHLPFIFSNESHDFHHSK